jgi:hypothetical protein
VDFFSRDFHVGLTLLQRSRRRVAGLVFHRSIRFHQFPQEEERNVTSKFPG